MSQYNNGWVTPHECLDYRSQNINCKGGGSCYTECHNLTMAGSLLLNVKITGHKISIATLNVTNINCWVTAALHMSRLQSPMFLPYLKQKHSLGPTFGQSPRPGRASDFDKF
jgi:hypothetical protein